MGRANVQYWQFGFTDNGGLKPQATDWIRKTIQSHKAHIGFFGFVD